MQELASSLMEGYQGYASEHPEADYSHLQEDFVSYLNSTEAQEILQRHIQTSLQAAVFPLHRNRSRNSFSGSSKGIRHT